MENYEEFTHTFAPKIRLKPADFFQIQKVYICMIDSTGRECYNI